MRTNAQNADCLMPAAPAEEFLAGLGGAPDGKPFEKALHGTHSATTGRLPCAVAAR